MPSFLLSFMFSLMIASPLTFAQSASAPAADCSKLIDNLRDFQINNKKVQDSVLNFVQNFSEKLRATPTPDAAALSEMADKTDEILGAGYDNNEKISKDLDTLMKQINDCIAAAPAPQKN